MLYKSPYLDLQVVRILKSTKIDFRLNPPITLNCSGEHDFDRIWVSIDRVLKINFLIPRKFFKASFVGRIIEIVLCETATEKSSRIQDLGITGTIHFGEIR